VAKFRFGGNGERALRSQTKRVRALGHELTEPLRDLDGLTLAAWPGIDLTKPVPKLKNNGQLFLPNDASMKIEQLRLQEARDPKTPWKKWGPYLGTPEKARSTAVQLVSAIETR
jgi:hypothetical protein